MPKKKTKTLTSATKKAKTTKKTAVKKPKKASVSKRRIATSAAKKAKKKIQIKKTKPATVTSATKTRAKAVPSVTSATKELERTEKLRKFLLGLREKILSEAKAEIAKYIKGETKQIVETALDDGDWSVVDLAEDISLRQLSTHRENLMKVDEALRKIDQGTYGICEECGEPITEERLRILPFAIYCRECQERKEVLEKIEKEYE
jgi:DnaK suppressor protein